MKLTGKQFTTVVVAIAFIVMAIMTMVIGNDDKDTSDKDQQQEQVIDDNDPADDEDDNDKAKDDTLLIVNEPLQGDPYQELDELIGLASVKTEIKSLANFVKLQKQRQAKGIKTPTLSYHMVFTGNPGTGKTTVARIVARIYKDIGILKKGHMVETDRSGMVAKYMGQTALKTNAIIDSALNGVLFIDEAYSLVPKESSSDYGQEAIATLLKRMEDDRDKLVVIIAGYTNEMKRFIDSNPGLQSRFSRYINFPDYSSAQLDSVFATYLKKNEYRIDDQAEALLREKLDYVVEHKDRNFGNARYVRNIFEKVIQAQANRLAGKRNLDKQQLTTLTKADIEKAFEK